VTAATWTYPYPHPAVTVDAVVFGVEDETLKVLLVERGFAPFAGSWAVPGGFVGPNEDLDTAARRELLEETGADVRYLEQLYTFGAPHRDPRERVITVAYYALVDLPAHRLESGSDAADARWFPVADLPSLAFDHERIVRTAVSRLRGKLSYAPVGFDLLATKFTLTELQRLYEVILGRGLDKRNFRRKVLATDVLVELDETRAGVAHRAPRLYRFDPDRYRARLEAGKEFEL
jgi:8-oxo-dGTP diphosphatase